MRELPDGDGWQYEPKWDGFRGCSRTPRASSGSGRATQGRSCATSPSCEPLEKLLPPRSALDGEIVIERGGVLDFDSMQTRLHPAESRVRKLSAEIPARFVAFDVLLVEGRGGVARAALETPRRGSSGARSASASPPATRDRDEALDWLERFEALGLDGVVAKRRDLPYLPARARAS